ncbi:hypothetical protein GGP41_010525 [Bipolaris sorokiniana]|nr:hypothetical protein GGP41_010525 [Bipolaris sorokiniana]
MLRTLKPKSVGPSDDTPLVVPQTPSSPINRRDPALNSGPISKTFRLLPRNPRTIRKLNKIKAASTIPSASTKREPESSSTGGTTAKTYTFEPSQQENVTVTIWSTDYSTTNELVTTESENNGNTETEEEDSEQQWLDHLMGAHDGRDPYGLASKPYLDAGLLPPWKRCRWCEESLVWLQGRGG